MTTTFGIRPGARVEMMIDGGYLFAVCRSLGFDIDFEALRNILLSEYDCRRMSYMLKVLYDDHGEIVQATVAKLLDFLRFNGYRTVLGEAREWTDAQGRRIVSNKSVDVSMALHMMQAARHVEELIIISGSDDLVDVCEECARMGSRVTLLASTRVALSNELRSTVDWFVEIGDIKDKILRREREPRDNAQNPRDIAPNIVRDESAVVVEDRRNQEMARRRSQRV